VVCLPGDSKILTESGLKEIKDLRGEKIYGFDGKKIKLQNFEDVIRLKGNFLGYEIKLDSKKVIATKDHMFLVYNNGRLEWKRLEEIKEGDLLVGIEY